MDYKEKINNFNLAFQNHFGVKPQPDLVETVIRLNLEKKITDYVEKFFCDSPANELAELLTQIGSGKAVGKSKR